jgi:tripartite-type tricarboxylate transporter receptor subunit TctC
MRTSRREILRVAAASPALVLPSLACAQAEYPAREVKSVCNFPAGSGADIFVRYFSEKLGQVSGKQFIVENRVGAFGTLGPESVARAKPDGYTVYIGSGTSSFVSSVHLFKKLNYDPLKDFTHITTVARLAVVLLTNPKMGFKSVGELTKYLREKGDKASYAAVTSTGSVAAELYKAAIGSTAVAVQYRSTATALNDMLDGQLAFTFGDAVFATEQARAGRLTALAVTAGERTSAMPEFPTMKEQGVPEVEFGTFWSFAAPAGLPQPILAKLEAWMNQIVLMDETRKFLNNLGADPYPGNSKMLPPLIAQRIKEWEGYVKLAKLEPI